jgi:large subunit ribosomal protein L3
MIQGLWGRKIGMTQLFVKDKVVPVTAIDISSWVVTNQKQQERDGYSAVQVGCLKTKYAESPFSSAWLKNLKKYFYFIKEVKVTELDDACVVGKSFASHALLQEGDVVDVVSRSKGAGFAGVVRRHGFSGARASHGAAMGKAPGSMSFMRSQGRVIKGKKLPGHMGNKKCMVRNLTVVKVHEDAPIILVKGSVPGKSGSLVFVRKNMGDRG